MRWVWATAICITLAMASGCDQPRAARDAGPPDAWFFCHWDCFPDSYCEDGVVWSQGSVVPCDEWTGECPRNQRGRCPRGCAPRTRDDRFADHWESLCACVTDEDCGAAESGCDTETGRCVGLVGPMAPLAPTEACSVDVSELFDESRETAYGVLADPTCESGLCRFTARATAGECDRHVCALRCVDSADCPLSFSCMDFPDWTDRSIEMGPEGSERVCVWGGDPALVCH